MKKHNARKKKVQARMNSQRQHLQGRSQQIRKSYIKFGGSTYQDAMQQLTGSYLEMLEENNIPHDMAFGMLHFKNQEDKYRFMYSICDDDGKSDYLTTNVTRTVALSGIEGVITVVSYKRDMIAEALEVYNTFYGKSESVFM